MKEGKITLDVDYYCIQCGHRKSISYCPIAIALDHVKEFDFKEIGVSPSEILGWTDKEIVSFKVPQEAKDFIKDFDNGNPVDPMVLTLEILSVKDLNEETRL